MSAQALLRSGVHLGDSLIHADPSNPDGHFEELIVTKHKQHCSPLLEG